MVTMMFFAVKQHVTIRFKKVKIVFAKIPFVLTFVTRLKRRLAVI